MTQAITGLNSQLAALRDRVAEDGFALSEELTFIDHGYSGATLLRPALERLRDVVALEGIDRLYVLSPDRLARRYAYQVLLVDECERAGCEVVFLNRDLGQSPEDALLLQVQGMIAEYERAKIMERSRRGKRHAAQAGKIAVLGGAPYGYHYVSKQEGGGQARYEIVEEEADAVRWIFHWVGIERLSIGEVCRRLGQQGYRTRTGKTYWDRSVVWGMLKNPAYKGEAAFGKTRAGPLRPRLRAQKGGSMQPRSGVSTCDVAPAQWTSIPVPALVEAALFDQVQQQLAENRQRARGRKRGARYLLQGLLCCSQCGYAYYGKAIIGKTAKGMESARKTLAAKHTVRQASVSYRRYYRDGLASKEWRHLQVRVERKDKAPLTAKCGETPLCTQKTAYTADRIVPHVIAGTRSELLRRLLAGKCELCGQRAELEAHHVKTVKALARRWRGRRHKPAWVAHMIARRRKTVVVCHDCHQAITHGRYDGRAVNRVGRA